MYNMEKERIENAPPEKGRKFHHWKKIENAQLEKA